MKLLMLNYEFPPLGGGAGNANYYILKEFAKYPDLQVDLVTSSVGVFKMGQFADNIKVHYIDIGKKDSGLHYQTNLDLLRYAWKAYSYAGNLKKQNGYDLCHAFFGIPCGYLAMKLRLPFIVSLRGSDVPFYNRRFYWPDRLFFSRLSRKIWRKAKKVVANSEGLKDLAMSASPGQEIAVIYNGINLEEFYPGRTNSKGMDGRIKLISVGRLIERKGYRYLVEALKGVENVELLLVGEGNLKEELEALAIQNGVSVMFAGKVDHKSIAERLRQSDLFVLPSLNEGMSNAIIEAMACGLPVVATDTGGSRELIDGNGFIVQKANVGELREAIAALAGNPGMIESMGRISSERAKKMAWAGVAENYYRIYCQLAGNS